MKYRSLIVLIGCFVLISTSARAAIVTLKPYLSLAEEYTDNRDLTNTDQREERSTIVSPGIDYAIAGKRGGMDLSYTAQYVTYHETDDVTIWRHNGSLSFWADMSKHTQFKLGSSFQRTDEPIRGPGYGLSEYIDSGGQYINSGGQLIPVGDTTYRSGRKEYQTTTSNLNLTHQFGEQDTISFYYLFSSMEELEIQDGNDNRQHMPAINLSYWMTPRFGFDMSARYTRGEFDNSDNYNSWDGNFQLNRKLTKHLQGYLSYDHTLHRYDTETERDYDIYAPSVGFSYQIEKYISLAVGVGYYYRNMEADTNEESFFLDASINKSWSYTRGSASLSGAAGLDRNDFGTENLGLQKFYSLNATASYSLTRHFHASVNVGYSRNEYIDSLDDRLDNQGQAGCSFSITPRPWLSINATYAHNLLRSNREESEYEENVGSLSISIFPRGHREVDTAEDETEWR